MKALLINPIFPKGFYTYDKLVKMFNKKAFVPPLGLVTVAALLPQDWDFRLIDCNIEPIEEHDWVWADIVMVTGMITQKTDMLGKIKEAKTRKKIVAVGGPFATHLPDEITQAGADFLVLDEGEETIPPFIEALKRGETSGIFRSVDKPDIRKTPIPRFDLLTIDKYVEMAVQFSRGCPFSCEFCDIITLFGRKPRTKEPQQLIAELQMLKDLGWRGGLLFVDDNFIGNKSMVKIFLKELIIWMRKNANPFPFKTETSVDLANDEELMDLMTKARFRTVFLGIETPDIESLIFIKKGQNTRNSLSESVQKIASKGIRVIGSFIIGFDGEKAGAGERIYQFADTNSIPTVTLTMLQALPGTALWKRLEKEKRILTKAGDISQSKIMNFIPTRPIEEIANEFLDTYNKLYEPRNYYRRTYQHLKILGESPLRKNPEIFLEQSKNSKFTISFKIIAAFLLFFFKSGVIRPGRLAFWKYLFKMLKKCQHMAFSYLAISAHIEHYLDYRKTIVSEIKEQLATGKKI